MSHPVSHSASPTRAGGPESLQTVFVFSGQGSQSYGMAKGLFDGDAAFRRVMMDLDLRFADALGHSVIERLYDPRRAKTEALDDVLVSHPAIFAVQYAVGQTLIEHGVTPALVLGASLGELAAAAIAGALSLDQAAAIVAAQARIFERAHLAGGMIAILHDLDLYRRTDVLARRSEIAAINYGEHFVIVGDDPGLAEIQDTLRAAGISFQRLAVRQPFHSSLIDHLRDDITGACAMPGALAPKIPFVSCTTAGPIARVDSDHLWSTLRRPIRIFDSVRDLERRGPFNYIDLGPGASFSNSIKRILEADSRSQIHQPLSPFSRGTDAFDRIVQALGRPRADVRDEPVPVRPSVAGVGRPPTRAATAYIFPGQGSQQRGMGAGLFERFSEMTALADRTLGYSIETLCTGDPERKLAQTQFTQPALYVVNALTYFRKREEDPSPPAFLAGHSLGEYNALLAAGAFDFEVGLQLVKKRGELMSRASAGAMAAVIGCQADQVMKIMAEHDLHTIDVANFNAPRQIVLSGSADDIRAAQGVFEARGAQYVMLNVSAPFHSRYMEPAVREFEAYLQRFQYSPLTCPVISNVTARPYEEGSIVRNLTEQLRRPVQWSDAIAYLIRQGVQEFEELGPGRVLTNLVRGIRREAQCYQ